MAVATTTQAGTAGDWAAKFLAAINAPITTNNINNVVAWGVAESGQPGHNQGHGGWTNYNPLNIVVQGGDRHTGQGGSQGNIADFGSVADGVAASARLFTGNRNAAPIINALRGDANINALNGAINQFYGSWGGSLHLAGASDAASGAQLNGTGGAGGNATLTSADDDCVLSLPGVDLGLFSLGGNCLINHSRGRALLGAAAMVGGVVVMLLGVAFIVAGTNAGKSAIKIAGRL